VNSFSIPGEVMPSPVSPTVSRNVPWEVAAGLGEARTGAFQSAGGAPDLLLQLIETQCHLTDLVARMGNHRSKVEVGFCRVQVTSRALLIPALIAG
jgi:hypothetical protein